MATDTRAAPSTLVKQRRAQAAQAFKSRPGAGVEGAPQNRAERRAKARQDNRKPTPVAVRRAAAAQRAVEPTNTQVLKSAVAEVAKDVKVAATELKRSAVSKSFFPWREMVVSLPLFIMFAIMMVAWWHIVGAQPAWLASVKPHVDTVTAVVTGGFLLSLVGISARSIAPALVVLLGAAGVAVFSDAFRAFGQGIILSGVLGLAWVIGPLPLLGGKFWRKSA